MITISNMIILQMLALIMLVNVILALVLRKYSIYKDSDFTVKDKRCNTTNSENT